jgi:hypothetical protein
MKNLPSALAALVLFAGLPATQAAVLITGITTAPTLANPETRNDTILTITTSVTTYASLSSATSITGISGAAEWVWGTSATNPGSVAAALTDLSLTTGSLNTGAGTIYGFNAVNSSTAFFVMGNYGGDNPATVFLVDAGGNAISASLTLPNSAPANDFASITVNRSAGGAALSRTVRGYVFEMSEFSFTGGNTVANVAGFKLSGASFDAQEVGIVAVPEPATLAFLAIGGLVCTLSRRRRN